MRTIPPAHPPNDPKAASTAPRSEASPRGEPGDNETGQDGAPQPREAGAGAGKGPGGERGPGPVAASPARPAAVAKEVSRLS